MQNPILGPLLAGALLLSVPAVSASPHPTYLPSGVEYDPAVPTPSDALGSEVGTWHARHDQIAAYFRLLAARSDRVRLEEFGRTHENRPQLLAVITSPENHANLDAIRERHAARTAPNADAPGADDPAVIWLGYSIHGNEASGANAALLVAYHLAAARGPDIEGLLTELVVLLDPALNPDGLDRFAVWVNANRSKDPVADPANREHHEPWPGGRTNHYWFDLNRDWLPAQHPESKNRLEIFHRWKPNVFCDYHEMGTDNTFFFQPGVPSRQNPLTPRRNLELTARFAEEHARALDAEKRLYYTQETFDDFYYGKGSTYPDLNGGVGILFEQASARGHVQDSPNGPVTFPFAIRNQFLTSLSTLRAARALRSDLLEYQAAFFRDARREADGDAARGYVFGETGDRGRTAELLAVLLAHRIEVRALARSITVDGVSYHPGSAYVVPAAQTQYRLIRTLFETVTAFPDSIFYDVSAWTLPLSMGLPWAAIRGEAFGGVLGGRVESAAPPPGRVVARDGDDPYAWAVPWTEYRAPRTLHRLLAAGVPVRLAAQGFTQETAEGRVRFAPGTLVVPAGLARGNAERVRPILETAAAEDGIAAYALSGGLTPEGIDLGSPNMRPLSLPKPLLVTGAGVDAYEAGEIWHLLDHRFDVTLTMVEQARFDRIDLDRYTHVILVDGRYDALDRQVDRMRAWVEAGGVLITAKGAARWAAGHEIIPLRFREAKTDSVDGNSPPGRIPYGAHGAQRGAAATSGAIFAATVDRTHPLGFGLPRDAIALFRDDNLYLEPSENPYGTVVLYDEEPLVAGYASAENVKRAAGSAGVVAHKRGRGAVVAFAQNPAFRAVWLGPQRLFLNALFLGSTIERTGE